MTDAVRRASAAPVDTDATAEPVRVRFERVAVIVDDAMVTRLRGVCARVDVDETSRLQAGRDWWPLSVRWAMGGEVPARAGAVARPATATEVAAVLAVCSEARIPVTAAGGRSGVCGNAVPLFGGVALDTTGLSGIAAVDSDSLLVDVRAGTFGDQLEADLRRAHGLTLGHWPQSIALSTVGGWLACRSAGQFSTRYGKIEDMVVGLEVALADGRVVHTGGQAPRAACGPDLNQLFVGSEGTLGVITEARLRAAPAPTAESRSAYGFASFADGLDACRRMLRRGARPAVLRLYDAAESSRSFGRSDGCVLLVADEGDPRIIASTMRVVDEEAATARRLESELVDQWMEERSDTSALEMAVRLGLTVDTIEVAARWSALAAVHREAIDALQRIDGTVVASAHQSHAYADGACLYFTFAGHPAADGASGSIVNAADSYYRRAWDAVVSVITAHGGALSHHHGVGLNRGRYLAGALGPAFDVLGAVKAALDPAGVLNPGKLGLPSPFGEVPWP
jgi:alkyldihydroxyacetonephosphate synthase